MTVLKIFRPKVEPDPEVRQCAEELRQATQAVHEAIAAQQQRATKTAQV